MERQIQKQDSQIYEITQHNWQQSWGIIPVTADSTPAQVLALNTPSLSLLGKDDEGKMAGITVFTAQVALLASFLGAPWSKYQVDECGELAYQEFYWFTIAELKQFLVRVKTGRYISHKNFTPAVFMEYLQQYASEMLQGRAEYYNSRKDVKWTPPEQPVSDETVNAALQSLTDLLNAERESEKEERRKSLQESKAAMAASLLAMGVPQTLIDQYWKP